VTDDEDLSVMSRIKKTGEMKPENQEEKSTKELIIDAAIDLFAQRGFDAMSMNEIADAVGIKKASIYFHFKSKEEIMDRIFEYFQHEIVATSTGDMTVVDAALDSIGLEGMMMASASFFEESTSNLRLQKIWRIIVMEMPRNTYIHDYYVKNNWDTPLATWELIFARAMKKKLIKPGDPKFLAMEFFSFFAFAMVEQSLMKYDDVLKGRELPVRHNMQNHVRFMMESLKI
jgi:AcrR family transcriptional regulator